MAARRYLPLLGLLLLSGCLFHVREQTDQVAVDLAAHPFDPAPDPTSAPPASAPQGGSAPAEKQASEAQPAEKAGPTAREGKTPLPDWDVQTTHYLQAREGASVKDLLPPKLNIPERIPGSEAELIKLPAEREKLAAEVRRLYPPLPPLPVYPRGELPPGGQPYTLMELQRLATANSPTIRQAAADVETARGNMIQAAMYPNPNAGVGLTPSNDNSTNTVPGIYFQQWIKTAGKLKIATAAAKKGLDTAELALKRARSDLATQVRSAYFNVLVARETVEVTQALAQFTDEIYRLQANLLMIGFAAAYEPAALRSSAYQARLAYRQAIEAYIYDWKQLAAVVATRDLPLSEVSGSIDRYIPEYDYHKALTWVLEHHTDVLTARAGIEMQKYNLKAAQVVPISDAYVAVSVNKESAVLPFQWFTTAAFGIVLPIWDQNKGGIRAAEGTLARALQEPVRVELTLTNTLAGAFAGYRNNVDALHAYRKEILPDLVRFYRGVYERRRIDPNAQFGDLVAAQSQLVAGVTGYLTTLAAVWTSVVALADVLQTDDLFQMGKPLSLPSLPKMDLPPFFLGAPGHPPADCGKQATGWPKPPLDMLPPANLGPASLPPIESGPNAAAPAPSVGETK